MKKNILNLYALAFCFVLNMQTSFAQLESASILTHPNYFANPREYLSGLDTLKINNDMLIDRTIYNDKILNVNGWNKVTSIDYTDWANIYQELQNAHEDTSRLLPFDTLLEYSRTLNFLEQVYVIGIIDYHFKRIKQSALDNSQLIQLDSTLNDDNATTNSYSSEHVIAASCFSHNIFGDQIKFKIDPLFFISNNLEEGLISMSVDFGNGEGYKNVAFDEIMVINYDDVSDYIELKIKLDYENVITEEIRSLYAHTSVYRQSSSNIPSPTVIDLVNTNSDNTPLPDQYPSRALYYYPAIQTQTITTEVCYWKYKAFSTVIDCKANPPTLGHIEHTFRTTTKKIIPEYRLEVAYLFNPSNNSGTNTNNRKLRRPFIMVDGFDYGNTRNYYETTHDKPADKLLPYQRDYRGLYEYLDGTQSPWNVVKFPRANLISDLQANGFDLVFINFMEGTGDVYQNAARLRGFLNEIINSPAFRDNQTEESILVGPSMGGLISRMALRQMELAGDEHYVKSWISFDSPHKGANISLALQQAMAYGAKWHLVSGKFKEKLPVLNSDAAKQLLMEHYSTSPTGDLETFTSVPHADHIKIQHDFDVMGFPIFSKNHSITNGGEWALYSGRQKIVDFTLLSFLTWATLKGWGGYGGNDLLFEGSRLGINNDQKLYTTNQIPHDSEPGGWTDALYALNFDVTNLGVIRNIDEIPVKWATFIPTNSAFGVSGNSFKTWKEFTNCNDNSSGKIKTPFDEIFGVSGECQQHMTITTETKLKVVNAWIKPDLITTSRPVIRVGPVINQTVSKPIAYNVKESISFGGSNNTITFKNGADVNIVSGKTITFLPGFSTDPGVKLHAKIQEENNTSISEQPDQLIKYQSENTNYLNNSHFIDKLYDYSSKTGIPITTKILDVIIFPNPTNDLVNIGIDGIDGQETTMKLFNSIGEMVISKNIISNGIYNFDLSKFSSGIYCLIINNTSSVFQSKIIKL